MNYRWLALALVTFLMCTAVHALAQTMDFHLGVGMKPSRSTPPEVIDMRWARQYLDDNATGAVNATGAANATRKEH